MEPFEQQINDVLAQPHSPEEDGPAQILVAAGDALCGEPLLDALRRRGHRCRRAPTVAEAYEALKEQPFNLVLVGSELPDGGGLELTRFVHETMPDGGAAKVIVLSTELSAHAAVRAMQCGAIDFMSAPVQETEFTARIEAALRRTRRDREREQRLARLKDLCHQLTLARHDICEQIDTLCHDLVFAYREMTEQVNEIATASEFRTLISQELDVEDLLRTSLEYLLKKTGPTNAAVFLPEGDGQFTLGAYVNYDCPRETISTTLESLSSAVCPRIADEPAIIVFELGSDFAEWIDSDAELFRESQVVAFSCAHEDECLALMVLFRSSDAPYDDSVVGVIETLRPIFAAQVARVIKVHHRARPQWPKEPADDEQDYHDDYGFGFGHAA
jgi:DNA-binding response OmpR family regulator